MAKSPATSDFDLPSGDVLTVGAGDLGRAAVRAIGKDSGAPAAYSCAGPVYGALWSGGIRRYAGWSEKPDFAEAVAEIWHMAADAQKGDRVDVIEICLSHGLEPISLKKIPHRLANRHRGVFGIEMEVGDYRVRYGPTEMIARNLSFERAFKLFLADRGMTQADFVRRGGRLLRFRARQILVTDFTEARAVDLFRGGQVVDPNSVTPATIETMIDMLGGWLEANADADGRMTYKYWPSRGTVSRADNPIRQFMASVCLRRLASFADCSNLRRLADSNLARNLDRFYRVRDGVGVIEHNGEAKLGAAALAALAILESGDEAAHREALAALDAGIVTLWRPDGSFRTFHFPAARASDNQNFYPGEAILYWAIKLSRARNGGLLARARTSFAYYRDWYRRSPNPAFVPWHSQAYVLLHELTGDSAFADFVFEMNDWLLSMQQWDRAPYDDLRGRFYDPKHPEYGPPHASSTSVYLEGLAAATRLAIAQGDEVREARYRRAIWRGVRNLRQLQFKDNTEMYYISQRARVRGGIRTETYDNTIRIDNVQHSLTALLALVDLPGFSSKPSIATA